MKNCLIILSAMLFWLQALTFWYDLGIGSMNKRDERRAEENVNNTSDGSGTIQIP